MKNEISTSGAPKAIGPYSQGVSLCKLIFTSGQIPVDPETGVVPDGVKAQTERSLKNLDAVITAGGSDKANILKVSVYLKNMNDYAAMNEVYSEFFKGTTCPARTCVEVARLPKDVLVEIEAIAAVK